MYKKLVAVLVAMAMVLSSSMVVMAGEADSSVLDLDLDSISTVGDDTEIKELLEDILVYVTDEEGSFESDQVRELIGLLFGHYKDGDTANFDKNYSAAAEAFVPIEEAIYMHMLDATSDSLETGDETIFSDLIASFDRPDDDTLRVFGNFVIMNFDVDEDCPDDLVVKNGAGRIELLTLTQNEDGTYEVTDCIEEEDGEGFADSIALMCEEIGIDLDSFYEALALNDLLYICNLHDFMEAHPEYDHIEYIGEMVTLDDLHEMIEEEFDAYLALYAIDAALTEAETEPTEGEASESADGESADAESADGESADTETTEGEADAELVDLHELIDLMLNEIVETAINVDLEAKEAVTGDEFSEEGTVFTLLEDVLNEIFSGRSDLGLEDSESLTEGIADLEALGEEDTLSEEELDDLLGLILLSIIAEAEENESEESSNPEDLIKANTFAIFVYETAKANEVIAEAVEATDSSLFEILDNNADELKPYVNEDGTMNVVTDMSEESFEAFEEELAKVEEYINGMEGPKQAALDLLDLVHSIQDDIHNTVHGHTHEEVEAAE